MNECFFEKILDEYDYFEYNCYSDVNCINIKGLFYCICYMGYFGNGVVCIGIFVCVCGEGVCFGWIVIDFY